MVRLPGAAATVCLPALVIFGFSRQQHQRKFSAQDKVAPLRTSWGCYQHWRSSSHFHL